MACEKCSANGDNVKHKQRESAEKRHAYETFPDRGTGAGSACHGGR